MNFLEISIIIFKKLGSISEEEYLEVVKPISEYPISYQFNSQAILV